MLNKRVHTNIHPVSLLLLLVNVVVVIVRHACCIGLEQGFHISLLVNCIAGMGTRRKSSRPRRDGLYLSRRDRDVRSTSFIDCNKRPMLSFTFIVL